jgi:hypothetical protein
MCVCVFIVGVLGHEAWSVFDQACLHRHACDVSATTSAHCVFTDCLCEGLALATNLHEDTPLPTSYLAQGDENETDVCVWLTSSRIPTTTCCFHHQIWRKAMRMLQTYIFG